MKNKKTIGMILLGVLLVLAGCAEPEVKISAVQVMLASGGYDVKIKLWDASSGDLLRTLPGYTYGVFTVAFAPNE